MAHTTDTPDAGQSRRPHHLHPAAVAAALTTAAGGLAGAALWWVTDWLSRSDVGEPRWSLRGSPRRS